MQEMKQSWAVAAVRPYDVYMKTLHTLVRDRLEGEDDKDILWDDEITKKLADFQKVAVKRLEERVGREKELRPRLAKADEMLNAGM